ncbi:MAG: DEAD/DEAH box helicase [Beijerinckiaceae bacterium]
MLPDHLPAPLAQALAERGYSDLTPVQASVVAPEAAGRDLLVSARTGSGKTVAFGLCIAPTLLDGADRFTSADQPLALVIAPTRELALQVQRELAWLYAPAGGRIVAAVGGMDPRRERRALEAGCHIVVGTPGRLRDHVERKALDLSGLRAVVLDEADEMLDMGFKEDLTFLLEATPSERRTLMFSATIPKAIAGLARDFQTDALRIASAGGETGHADITYVAMHTGPKDAEKAIVNILREKDAEAAIIFCRTRESVKRLHAVLAERGFTAVCLSGELSQGERNHALQALRDGRAKVCVATDVAARGIDLPHLSLVIHADLPTNAEVLQHRSGRTGRAGRKGTSILLVPPAARRKAERLLAEAKVRPTWGDPPDADSIRALDRERFLKDPLLAEETTEDDMAMGARLLQTRPAEEIAAILARLYRSRLPEPEELTPPMAEVFQDRPGRKRQKHDDRFDRDDRSGRGGKFERDRPERSRDDRKSRHPAYARQTHESAPIEERAPRGESVVFRLDVGRRDRADPKWLLPMLCRMGGVTRQDIGAIRISDATTEFEVSARAARDFARNAERNGSEDMVLTAADGAPVARATKPPRKERFRPDAARADEKPHGKPFRKRAHGDRAYEDRPPYGGGTEGQRPEKPRSDGESRPPAPYRKAKSRFEPAQADGERPRRFKGSPDPKRHSRTGFQHRKGGKGSPRD